VVNENSGKALDVTGGDFAQGTPLQQWTKGAKSPSGIPGGDQQFEIVIENTGTRYLVAVDGSKDYYVTSSTQGKPLTLSTYPTSGAVLKKSGPYYEFVNTGLVMDATGKSTANGTPVQGYKLLDGTNQQWSLP
jgi:ricin-type beta-trefoil lectin protein